jgi:hypothetical protein
LSLSLSVGCSNTGTYLGTVTATFSGGTSTGYEIQAGYAGVYSTYTAVSSPFTITYQVAPYNASTGLRNTTGGSDTFTVRLKDSSGTVSNQATAINCSYPTPTPTTTPTPTPGPTPGPTPDPTPGPTPDPTPDPTPGPTPDPTAPPVTYTQFHDCAFNNWYVVGTETCDGLSNEVTDQCVFNDGTTTSPSGTQMFNFNCGDCLCP